MLLPIYHTTCGVYLGFGIILENEDENNVMKSNANVMHYIIEHLKNIYKYAACIIDLLIT